MATRDQYLQRTQLLLNDPKMERYNLFDLLTYVNIGRGQVAGEGECIRQYGQLAAGPGANQYPFSLITIPVAAAGLGGFNHVRAITYQIASGSLRVTAREWEWFNNYVISQAVPFVGPPKWWAQFGQGAAGTLFVNYLDFTYTLNLDLVCFPADLVGFGDPDAVPYAWSDAVPYYAAYLAKLTRPEDEQGAERMLQLYQLHMERARRFATPAVLPHQYAQAPDPTLPAKLGIAPKREAA